MVSYPNIRELDVALLPTGFFKNQNKMSANFVNIRAILVIAFISVIHFGDNFLSVESFELNPSGYACKVDFKDKEEKVKAIIDCATKVNYKFPTEISVDAVQAEMKRLVSSDYDDMVK